MGRSICKGYGPNMYITVTSVGQLFSGLFGKINEFFYADQAGKWYPTFVWQDISNSPCYAVGPFSSFGVKSCEKTGLTKDPKLMTPLSKSK